MSNHAKISIEPLRRISLDDGDVLHALKKSDKGYLDFGEAYFSLINYNAIKAWKCHKSMTLNLVVPVGKVKFVFINSEIDNFEVIEIGIDSYNRITVPPGIWFGFKGLYESGSLIMNISDIEHDSEEVLRKPINNFEYNW